MQKQICLEGKDCHRTHLARAGTRINYYYYYYYARHASSPSLQLSLQEGTGESAPDQSRVQHNVGLYAHVQLTCTHHNYVIMEMLQIAL